MQMHTSKTVTDLNSVSYISTRGQAPHLSFEDVVLTGLAEDGGLYVPEHVPHLTAHDIQKISQMSYVDVAKYVIQIFIGDVVSKDELSDLVDKAYSSFHHDEICPLVELENNIWVMEQFHGPTLAFKDFALQFLGQVFDFILEKQNKKITIVGATSGDTGSAAIEGCRGRKSMDIFILHPYGRVSDVQRRQMTTIHDENVHNIAIEGSFDDCQDLVKAMFNDHDFRHQIHMSAVNSINWARIMAQIVYYVYAASRFPDGVAFSVPTGNFGNVYAGYLAKKMGLPIDHLIVATNKNDILYRFFQIGEMMIEGVEPSLSPSMDIQVSSNFERLLFDVLDRNSDATRQTMLDFRALGRFSLDQSLLQVLKKTFLSYRCDDTETLNTIKKYHNDYDYMADPHTATGLSAAECFRADHVKYAGDIVTLSTAHPAKFPDALDQAISVRPELPEWVPHVNVAEERYARLPNELDVVKKYILKHID